MSDERAPELHPVLLRLYQRRVTPYVVTTFDIQISTLPGYPAGWTYPTPDGFLRYKNATKGSSPKYAWPDGSNARGIYHAWDIEDAIGEAGGVVWMVSGEADVWAMRSAWIPNVISGYGESTLPEHLLETLQRWGVQRVCIAPDRDLAGAAWADKLATLLRGTGIELSARRIPDDMGEKADVGKAWQLFKYEKGFENWLLALPEYDARPIPNPPKKPQRSMIPRGVLPENTERICTALQVRAFKPNGWSRNLVQCPDRSHHRHDDIHPSMSVHKEIGGKCHTSGNLYLWRELADLLGITWKRPDLDLPAPPIPEPEFRGLSVEHRAGLITWGCTSLARVTDALYRADYRGGETFTKGELRALCHGFVSAYTVTKALAQARGERLDHTGNTPTKSRRSREGRYFWNAFCNIYSSPIDVAKSDSKFPNTSEIAPAAIPVGNDEGAGGQPAQGEALKPGRGRPLRRFRLPTPAELAEVLGLIWETYAPMDPAKLRKASHYRAEVMAAPIRQHPGQYSRRQLAKPLGVSARTTYAYQEHADLEALPRVRKRALSWGQIEDLMKVLPVTLPKRPRAYKYFEVQEGGESYQHTKAGLKSAQEAARGGPVYECTQEANYYRARGTE